MPLAQQPTAIVTDPRRYITAIHGAAGVGKTTFGAQVPGHYFFYTPNAGVEGLEVFGDPILTWPEFIGKAKELLAAKEQNFEGQRTVEVCVVDNLTDLFDYAGSEVCKTQSFMEKGVAKKYDKIEDVPFGKGLKATAQLLLRNLGTLYLRGFGILLISHTKERSVKWAGADHMHYGFNLPPSAAKMVEAFCGAIGHFVIEETIERNEHGEIVKAEQGRWMLWQGAFLRLAKHRLKAFPEKLPLPLDKGWTTYCDAFTETIAKVKAQKQGAVV